MIKTTAERVLTTANSKAPNVEALPSPPKPPSVVSGAKVLDLFDRQGGAKKTQAVQIQSPAPPRSMLLNDYQTQALFSARPISKNPTSEHIALDLASLALGVTCESAEVVQCFLEASSGEGELDGRELCWELGDVLWYVATLADRMGLSLQKVAEFSLGEMEKKRLLRPGESKANRTLGEYQGAVLRAYPPVERGTDETMFLRTLTDDALRLSSESGDLGSFFQRAIGQGHSFDVDRGQQKLAHLLQRLATLAGKVGLSLDDVGNANITKLRGRYPHGFNTEDSVLRQRAL